MSNIWQVNGLKTCRVTYFFEIKMTYCINLMFYRHHLYQIKIFISYIVLICNIFDNF
jgi:hypothetical protein